MSRAAIARPSRHPRTPLELVEAYVEQFVHHGLPWQSTPLLAGVLLVAIIAGSLAALGTAADWLVGEAVVLSERSGLSKVVIGATVVSLGTTTPEAAVSVMAAVRGKPDIALGNAVGSIICDTGLVLGIACLIAPLPLHRHVVNRQGWVQFGAGVLLVLAAWPWATPVAAFSTGGHVAQFWGFVFLGLLAWYIWQSIRWARQFRDTVSLEEFEGDARSSNAVMVLRLVLSLAVVILASQVLIPAVTEAAERMQVPQGVIAATLVAFGTSLPELVTAVTAARRGHGDLAVGNVVGADILNVLFVSGAAAAVTPGGLDAPPQFFRVLFPAMLIVLVVFRLGIAFSGDALKRGFGFVLLATYVAASVLGYVF